MPCIKAEQTGAIAITMPQSPSIGTPNYHFYLTKIPLKTWSTLTLKLQELYLEKIFSARIQDRVSSVQIVVIPQNNRFEVLALNTKITRQERELFGEESYSHQELVDVCMKYNTKNFKKIQWSLKNICI